jgi:hypothetical protein
MIAIVDYFHSPYRLASEELASSGLTGKKIPRGLIESHPTNGTGYVSNTLWTNSIPIHHPEENEFFAAFAQLVIIGSQGTLPYGLQCPLRHGKCESFLRWRPRRRVPLDRSLCFSTFGDAKPDSFTPVTEFASGSMRAIPGATSEDEFVACWAAGGGGWGPPSGRGGAPS